MIRSLKCLMSRRKILSRLAKGALVSVAAPLAARAQDHTHHHDSMTPPPPSLIPSNRTELAVGYQTLKITQKNTKATTVNNLYPGPLLRWKEGEQVNIAVTNHLQEPTSIHWHGIVLPSEMDGVPGLSFDGIKPNETFTYQFRVQQSGTYWYHSHSAHQEQTGLMGPIIIDPKEPEPIRYDRDLVLMLSDWTDEKPERIYAKLKKHSDYYNYRQPTLLDKTPLDPMWQKMRMSPTDIADVTGATYTYLLNGQSNRHPWQALFKPGEALRLRVINGSAMTFFDLRIPGVKLQVVAADGQWVKPVEVDDLRVGIAEVYDLLITLPDDKPVCFFAQAMDRSGYVVGHITPKENWFAPVPTMDEAPLLSHEDMGMGNMEGEAMGAGHQHASTENTAPHDHSQMSSAEPVVEHSAMGHTGMDHSQMDHAAMDHAAMDHAAMDHSQMDHSTMNHADHGMSVVESPAVAPLAKAGFGVNFDAATPVKHKASEAGPQIDMLSMNPASGLADPGVGLRHHEHRFGRRVFTYADLRSLYPTADTRQPTREIELHLNGNMHRYMWSIDGMTYHQAPPIQLKHGERVRFILVNDTMMAHPFHLHGLWSELETGDPNFIPKKHTVIVQPGKKISYLVTADAEGRWAYHCHLMFHMMGMMREVRVVR